MKNLAMFANGSQVGECNFTKMKSFIVKAQIKTDPKTGKKKIVGLHFSDNDVRKLTDKDFVKSAR